MALRISSGLYKGYVIKVPKSIRPTEGKVREAIFNILSGFMPGSRVLDGYAGSGALGIEALSRGAESVTFVDQDTQAVLAIRDNLRKVAPDLERGRWRIMHQDCCDAMVALAEEKGRFDVIFLDPPYPGLEAKKALKTLRECDILAPSGVAVIEHRRDIPFPPDEGPMRLLKEHRYGTTVLSLYQMGLQEPS